MKNVKNQELVKNVKFVGLICDKSLQKGFNLSFSKLLRNTIFLLVCFTETKYVCVILVLNCIFIDLILKNIKIKSNRLIFRTKRFIVY